MTLIFALLLSPLMTEACNQVTNKAGHTLTDRQGKIVYNPSKFTPQEAAKDKPVILTTKEKREHLAKLNFSYNSSKVRTDAQDLLMNTAQELDKSKFKKIIVQGYADQSGRKSYNKKLSLKRAKAVKAWLTKWGIPAEKISTEAIGENFKKNRRSARRVEIKVVR